MERQETLDNVRALLDALEDNPEVPMPYYFKSAFGFTLHASDENELLACRKLLGRKVEKFFDDYSVGFKGTIGSATVKAELSRGQVCEKRVVGTKTIPAQPEREVDVVEWDCPDSVLNKLANT